LRYEWQVCECLKWQTIRVAARMVADGALIQIVVWPSEATAWVGATMIEFRLEFTE
jgi:hypothetical protein